MPTISKHYDNLLADFYSWLFGDFDEKVKEFERYFKKIGIHPEMSKTALDLGAGSGFQSIALAKKGFKVIAIDLCKKLIDELDRKKGHLDIKIIQDDLLSFKKWIFDKVELVVCMGDTLTHLESLEDVEILIKHVYDYLEDTGQFILTFRDLTYRVHHTDRFIPVKSDENTIFTCFLEYEEEHVKVHDLVYKKKGNKWDFKKSYYRKLIIDPDWMKSKMEENKFGIKQFYLNKGMTTIIARK